MAHKEVKLKREFTCRQQEIKKKCTQGKRPANLVNLRDTGCQIIDRSQIELPSEHQHIFVYLLFNNILVESLSDTKHRINGITHFDEKNYLRR